MAQRAELGQVHLLVAGAARRSCSGLVATWFWVVSRLVEPMVYSLYPFDSSGHLKVEPEVVHRTWKELADLSRRFD